MNDRYAELLAEYKRLAKRADQRLVRLEQLAQQEHYKGVLTYSYARAMRDIKAWSGEEATRFNLKAPGRIDQLQAKIRDIEHFLNAPTSSKSGITKVYKERTSTVNKLYSTNFKWQDLAKYYESAESQKMAEQYGSKTLVRSLGAIRRIANNPDEIAEVIAGNHKAANDSEINNMVVDILQQYPGIEKIFAR